MVWNMRPEAGYPAAGMAEHVCLPAAENVSRKCYCQDNAKKYVKVRIWERKGSAGNGH